MKNKKSRKPYPSTKKKTSNAKIIVTILLVFVLLCGAIVGTIAAISDGFTKPVEEWFSDKVTVTPGGDQGDQTGDNDQDFKPEVCNHIFDHGVCVDCGSHVEDVIPFTTKVISADEDCTINYWTQDYQLIKSETVKGGDTFAGLDGYNNYLFMFDNKINVPSYENANETSRLINGKFYSTYEYGDACFASLFPRYYKDAEKEGILIYGSPNIFCKYNDRYIEFTTDDKNPFYKPIGDMDVNDIYCKIDADTTLLKLSEGDRLEIFTNGLRPYVYNNIFFFAFSINDVQIKNSLDAINVIVMDYSEGA